MHLGSLPESGIGKLLLIMVLGMPLNTGWGQVPNLDDAKTANQARTPHAVDTSNGAEASGENRYDERQTVSEAHVSPATVSPNEVTETRQKKRNLTGFWVIGMLINIVVISAFVVWAVGQWRKTGR